MFTNNKKLVSTDILYSIEYKKIDPQIEHLFASRFICITLLGLTDSKLYDWYNSIQNRNHPFRTDWCTKIINDNEYACRLKIEDIQYDASSNIIYLEFFVPDPITQKYIPAMIAYQKMLSDINCIYPEIETNITDDSIYCLNIFLK